MNDFLKLEYEKEKEVCFKLTPEQKKEISEKIKLMLDKFFGENYKFGEKN